MPNRTIYLTQANADTLSSQENQSGLVNRLLTNYFAGKTVIHRTRLDASDDKKQKFEELKTKYPPLAPVPEESPSAIVEQKIATMREQTIAPPEYGA